MQPPEGTTRAHFAFPEPPFELAGELTIPFEVQLEPEPEPEVKPGADAEGE